jgi:hypothetical protein
MLTNQELIALWSNDKKRRDFLQDYKSWGVWFEQPELGVTFYKYELPDGARIIVESYMRKAHPYEKDGLDVSMARFHLQKAGDYYDPHVTGEYEIAAHLKLLKAELVKKQKNGAGDSGEGLACDAQQ